MPEASRPEVLANYNNQAGTTAELYEDTKQVPNDVWQAIQLGEREAMRARVPAERWDEVDALVRLDDFKTFRDRRVDPNEQAGKDGWNQEQLFRNPALVVSRDSSKRVIGAVLTANNTSGSTIRKGRLELSWKAEAWPKMLTPPELDLPKIGGKRYVHLREAYILPDFQEALDVEDDVIVVSGITLIGLSKSLLHRSTQQKLVAYRNSGDPVDGELSDLTRALNMQPTDERDNPVPGYMPGTKLVRVEAKITDIFQSLVEMPGISYDYTN